jgi:hypothetical protein
MLELKIQCETPEEANVHLNAFGYLNLITDLYMALHTARKHGTDADVLVVVENFYPDLTKAMDHHQGAY